MADGYRGVFGAFPYAFRRSGSWLFRSYVVVSALLAAALSLLFGFGLVVLIARTATVAGGSLTLSRAFYVLVGLLVVAPIIAPTLFVARAHRRDIERPDAYDPLLAVAGYLFLVSLYAGAVAAMPETFVIDGETVRRPPPTGPFAPAVAFLYGLPRPAALLPPVVSALLILAVHRVAGRGTGT